VSIAAPAVGVSFWVSDGAALNLDVGFGLALLDRGDPPVAIAATLGLDYHFRAPTRALRPLFSIAAAFDMLLAGGSSRIGVSAQVGAGAAYFFAPSFSLTGKLLLAIPVSVSPTFSLAFFTLTPGVVASWYF
jgi:hypothetical protein